MARPLIHADAVGMRSTGWRDVLPLSSRGLSELYLKRQSDRVSLLVGIGVGTPLGGGFIFDTVPPGFEAMAIMQHLPMPMYAEHTGALQALVRVASGGRPYLQVWSQAPAWGLLEYDTDKPFPTIYPGSPR